MKYIILLYGSQQDYDVMAGRSADHPTLSPEDFAPMHAFIESWNNELVESGEFVVDVRPILDSAADLEI